MSSVLTHKTSEIISEILRAAGVLPNGTAISLNSRDSTVPDVSVLISDTESRGLQRRQDGITDEAPGIQVRIRGAPYHQDAPRNLILIVDTMLASVARLSISYGGSVYLVSGVHRTGAVLPFPKDENHRYEWSWNGIVRLIQVS